MFRSLVLLVGALMLSACAIGNQYDYRSMTPPVAAKGEKSVAVAITDERPYIVSGDKPPSFIGLQRGGYGNPFDVNTVSGQPMISDMADGLVRTLKSRGFDARKMATQPGRLLKAPSTEDDRTLHIALLEWKSDVFSQITLNWNMIVRVFDASGAVLAEVSDQGQQGVGGGAFQDEKSRLTIAAANTKFAELLNKPEIKAALE